MVKKKPAPTTSPGVEVKPSQKSQADKPNKKTGMSAGFKRASGNKSSDKRIVQSQQPKNRSFPIVGIGASAGGLEAFTHLLNHLPEDTGMAFVLVQHLDPKHESILPEILSKATGMPVKKVENGMHVEPNHVYIIPPNTNMGISDGILNLILRPKTSAPHMPIDHFLRSLAEDQKSKAIGVILSGTGSDGAIGIEAIKAEGGILFVQTEESAKYNGMPHSAISTGCVDFILPLEGIAQELANIGRHPYVTYPYTVSPKSLEEDILIPKDDGSLNKIFTLLKVATGVDFSYYKHTTVNRRIMRRMVLRKVEKLEDYLRYLKDYPNEVDALYQDILIKVTGFFRNPEAFEALESRVFPIIMENRAADEPIRIWVPGCSTGEEVYSIAICLVEFLGGISSTNIPIQVFATDISESAIDKARSGVYLENIVADVSPERLRRFFIKIERGYQVARSIRDMCVFAKQNLVKDPPFSRLDLISCRNVMIYLGPVLQKRVMQTFHYSLKPSGFLILGSAETMNGFSDMFSRIDKKHRIFSRKATPGRLFLDFSSSIHGSEKKQVGKEGEDTRTGFDIYKEADHITLSKYAPAGIIVNDDMDVLQFRGRTGPYLEPAPGKASLNLLKMAREGLMLELRTAIQSVKNTGTPVRKEGIRINHNDQIGDVAIEVIPIKGSHSKERYFLVLFEDISQGSGLNSPEARQIKRAKPEKVDKKAESRQVIRLKDELAVAKEYMQSIVQEQEATNEELKSANEEILSSNEELQSMNEELETAKEELQSSNEELNTVNEELQNRNLELSQVNNDLNNLLSSVNIPIVMIENDMRIRRFTPVSEKVLNLIPTDIGRLISDINLNVDISDLDRMIADVIDNVSSKEQEVQNKRGHWYKMQIRPYRTSENKIDGAVILLVDIDIPKRSMEQIKEARDYAEAIIETVREPLVILDAKLCVKTANRSFYSTFQISIEETENKFIYELGNGQWNIPRLRTLLEDILSKSTQFQDFEVSHEFPRLGHRTMVLNARRIYAKEDTQMILLAIEDITERKRKHSDEVQRKEILLREIHHRVKNNLQVISGLLNLQSGYIKDPQAMETFKESQIRIRSISLIHEQLYQSKRLEVTSIDFDRYVHQLVSYLLRSYGVDSDRIALNINGGDISLGLDTAIPCGLIINELISNSLKYAFPGDRGGEIYVDIHREGDDNYTMTVGDNGIGFPEDLDFQKTTGSLGLQLVIMLVEQIGGAVELDRGNGTEFKIRFKEPKKKEG